MVRHGKGACEGAVAWQGVAAQVRSEAGELTWYWELLLISFIWIS